MTVPVSEPRLIGAQVLPYPGDVAATPAVVDADVEDSVNDRRIDPAFAEFEEVLIAVIVTESLTVVATKEWVRTAVADSPSVIESVAASIVSEFAITVEEDGTTESIPNPKAATATSAMRLKVVFVDICFLSISRTMEVP